jgi:hypothetical protein
MMPKGAARRERQRQREFKDKREHQHRPARCGKVMAHEFRLSPINRWQRRERADDSSLAAAFHPLAALVAELVLLAQQTLPNSSIAALDSGAQFLHVVTAHAPTPSFISAFLRKCRRRKGCECNSDQPNT